MSPDGDLVTSDHVDHLAVLEPGALQAEAREAGFEAAGALPVAPTELHVGSEIVLFARSA